MRTLLILLPLLFLPACAGLTARQEVAVPALQQAWGSYSRGIYADSRAGIDAKQRVAGEAAALRLLVDDMGDALKEGSIARIVRVDWLSIRDLADLGVTAKELEGKIGPGVAAGKREKVRLFSRLFFLLKGPVPNR